MYSLTVEKISIDGKQITTYGIAWNGENPTAVQDVSLCESAVRALLERLNALSLDPTQLSEVIDDFLCAKGDF
jgi:hypothetical protein